MSFEFTVSDVIPASPQAIYNAWLDAKGHTAMTGGKAAQCSAEPGGTFTVWDGYITGRNLQLEPYWRIVQSWRTTKFTAADSDSQIEVVLEPVPGGTRVSVHHGNVPDGHTSYRDGGWQRSYFEPMKLYFAGALTPAKRAAKTSTKKKSTSKAKKTKRRIKKRTKRGKKKKG
ncbi:MAG: SRPBCC domain-containing protein [Stellaceae bacterium]|jgi:activator of HSP90 ATPase